VLREGVQMRPYRGIFNYFSKIITLENNFIIQRDLADEVIDSIFYEQELAQVKKNLEEEQFIIDCVIKNRRRRVNKCGYPSKFVWIPVLSLISLRDEEGTISSGNFRVTAVCVIFRIIQHHPSSQNYLTLQCCTDNGR